MLPLTAVGGVVWIVFSLVEPILFLLLHMVLSFVGISEFNTCIAAGEARATTAKFQACKTVENMPEYRLLFEMLNRTIGGEHVCVAKIVDIELVHTCSVIPVNLSEREDTVRKGISYMHDGFNVEVMFYEPGPSLQFYQTKLRSCSMYEIFCA